MSNSSITLVCVGDGGVGKTALLYVYSNDLFITEYNATIFDNYQTQVLVDNQVYILDLWDTAGQESYDRLRPLSYHNADVILVCFSVDNHASYENVLNRWAVEIRHHASNCQIVLAATKIDLRTDKKVVDELAAQGKELLTFEDGMAMKERINAAAYVECSALQQLGVKAVFDECISQALTSDDEDEEEEQSGGICNLL
ncbi:hypothetical protein PCE1_000321 [Barthelona sp. PCE]